MSIEAHAATACQRSGEKSSDAKNAVEVRPAEPSDAEKIIKFYESLDAESVFMRFHFFLKDFTAYVAEQFRRGSAVLVAISCGEVIGVAEAVPISAETAEFGIIVRREWRRKGIGTALAVSLAKSCRERNIRFLLARVSIENEPAIRIARRLGASVRLSEEPGIVEIEADLSTVRP